MEPLKEVLKKIQQNKFSETQMENFIEDHAGLDPRKLTDLKNEVMVFQQECKSRGKAPHYLNRFERLVSEYLSIATYPADRAKRGGNKTFSSKHKPHKDVIYEWYGKLKSEFGVKTGFYKLCDKIKEKDLDKEEYISTDTPENFNKAYNDWITKQHEKSTSQS
jgi:hypothetical protein